MTVRIKTSIAWITSFLLIFAIWSVRYQMINIQSALIIGILGTLLIFGAEFGYSYRKKGLVKAGSIKNWLRVHIFIGIVGPLVIIWHTGLNFYGFAGWLTGLTVLVVISGFIGRYIFRRVPKAIKGHTSSLEELDAKKDELVGDFGALTGKSREATRLIEKILQDIESLERATLPENLKEADSTFKRARFWLRVNLTIDWYVTRLRARRLFARRHPSVYQLAKNLWALETRRLNTVRQISLLKTSKSMMAKWRLVHTPLTLLLFSGILIHTVTVIYYGKVFA